MMDDIITCNSLQISDTADKNDFNVAIKVLLVENIMKTADKETTKNRNKQLNVIDVWINNLKLFFLQF